MKVAISDKYDSARRTLTVGWVRLWWPFPIAEGLHGSGAMVLGWRVFGAKAPRWISVLFRAFRWASNKQYAFKYRYVRRHQYNIVRTDLPPGYYDIESVMLHACMKLMRRYIEEEHDGEESLAKFSAELRAEPDQNAEGADISQAQRQEDVLDVYRWWMRDRHKDIARKDELLHRLYGDGRMSFKPTDNPYLKEAVFEPFVGDEIAMHEEFRALEAKIEEDEDRMLHRLIDLRRGMWT